jgi:AraC-like DNA-binding protein
MLDELTDLTPRAPALERRVGHALALWNMGPQVAAVGDVARAVGVSPAQFRALFKRAIGISPRRYRLWTLLLRGFAGGPSSDATRLAHESGFADLAHFSRTCRDFFGYAPSRLIGQRVVQVPALDEADDEEPPTCERVMGVDPKFAKTLSAEFNSAIAREAFKTEWADRSSDNAD